MTFPIDIHIGSAVVSAHMVFDILAYFAAYRYFLWWKARSSLAPLEPIAEWKIILSGAAGALVGSHLVGALELPDALQNIGDFWYSFAASKTVAGGIAGGILGIEIMKKILHLRRKTGDIFVFPLIVGMFIGRIGCLLTGVTDGTVGLPSDLPWAFDQGDGISRHPTTMYEMLVLVMIFILLMQLRKARFHTEGMLFRLFCVVYFSYRFLAEWIKPVYPILFNLTIIQWVSMIIVLCYGISILSAAYKKE